MTEQFKPPRGNPRAPKIAAPKLKRLRLPLIAALTFGTGGAAAILWVTDGQTAIEAAMILVKGRAVTGRIVKISASDGILRSRFWYQLQLNVDGREVTAVSGGREEARRRGDPRPPQAADRLGAVVPVLYYVGATPQAWFVENTRSPLLGAAMAAFWLLSGMVGLFVGQRRLARENQSRFS